MARGIISTILGGVAGGLEGRRDQYLRQQEEAERQRVREEENAWRQRMFDAQQSQAQFANAMQARSMGGTVGGAPRLTREVATPPPEREALRSALFEAGQEGPEDRFIPREDFSEFRRPRTEFVIDPDYEEMSFGDQTFAFRTLEAMERMQAERESAAAAARKAEKEIDQQDRLDRDAARFGHERAMVLMRAQQDAQDAEGPGKDDALSNERIEAALLQVILAGKPKYDEDGYEVGKEPYAAGEIRKMRSLIDASLNRMSGAGEGRGPMPRTGMNFLGTYATPRLTTGERRQPAPVQEEPRPMSQPPMIGLSPEVRNLLGYGNPSNPVRRPY